MDGVLGVDVSLEGMCKARAIGVLDERDLDHEGSIM